MNRLTSPLRGLLLLGLLALLPGLAAAQVPSDWDARRVQQTREDLQELLERFEETSQSTAYSPEFRARARYEAALIRSRLKEGDFQVGDQIALAVEGEAELSKAFTVTPQRTLTLPVVGEVPLTGVLRSELQPHLAAYLARFIREPVVQARSSIRILISGGVVKPGWLVVDTETLLSDALMAAGGPTQDARLTQLRVERGTDPVWEGTALQQAIAEGRTINQLGLRAGDHVVIPTQAASRGGNALRLAMTSIPAALLAVSTLIQIFR